MDFFEPKETAWKVTDKVGVVDAMPAKSAGSNAALDSGANQGLAIEDFGKSAKGKADNIKCDYNIGVTSQLGK